MYVSPVVTAFTTLSPMSYLHLEPRQTETESGTLAVAELVSQRLNVLGSVFDVLAEFQNKA